MTCMNRATADKASALYGASRSITFLKLIQTQYFCNSLCHVCVRFDRCSFNALMVKCSGLMALYWSIRTTSCLYMHWIPNICKVVVDELKDSCTQTCAYSLYSSNSGWKCALSWFAGFHPQYGLKVQSRLKPVDPEWPIREPLVVFMCPAVVKRWIFLRQNIWDLFQIPVVETGEP